MSEPTPVDMPTVEHEGPSPVDMPTVTNDGPPPVPMPTWPAPGPSTDSHDELGDEVRAAEAAQQRSLCVSPDDVDEDVRDQCASDLAEALDLRVEVNRAQHDGGEVRRVGATDPRVRELEAPWTRKARRAAGSTIPNQEGQS